MRSGKAGDAFVKWLLGVLSALTVLAVSGLAHTVLRHELALRDLDCTKKKRHVAAVPPPTIWSAFGFSSLNASENLRKDEHEKPEP